MRFRNISNQWSAEREVVFKGFSCVHWCVTLHTLKDGSEHHTVSRDNALDGSASRILIWDKWSEWQTNKGKKMTRNRLPSWMTDPFIVSCDISTSPWEPVLLISHLDANLYHRHRLKVNSEKDRSKKNRRNSERSKTKSIK